MADVIELIEADHRRILHLSDALQDACHYCQGPQTRWVLATLGDRLAALVETHAEAEEEVCYLALYGSSPRGLEQLDEAAADHDDIRRAVREADLQPVGSAEWWRVAQAALAACTEHFDRDERGVLADFGQRAI